MKKTEIKNIMIIFADNDFVSVFDWIGKVALNTITNNNICDRAVLEDATDIENFIKSLLPTAIEFLQYRTDKYAKFCRYENITNAKLVDLVNSFISNIEFVYNSDDIAFYINECETLIIDLELNTSYIR